MDMGKAIILKKKDGEKVYPISASDLIFNPETKRTVKDDLEGKIGDAPSDGKQYVRKNGAWGEVDIPESGSKEFVNITLLTNKSDHSALNGTNIKVQYSDITKNYTYNGSQLTIEIPSGLEYTITPDEVSGYFTPKSVTLISVGGNSRDIKLIYINAFITTIRINQNISDPASMITRIVDEGGIEYIRKNSHRYTGTFANGIMTLKQLDDNDGTKYVDGTNAALTTLGTDVWMKLPQFHWKCTEYATNVWDFELAYGAKPDNTYKTWDGNDLIGVYEAYNSSQKIYSTSGVESSGSINQTDLKTYARARGEGFSLVKWKHHCMMAMLYYTMYCNTNCQDMIGIGTNVHTKVTGATNLLGMTDTVSEVNGNTGSINFWGLENWWGNKYEFIDNVTLDARVWKVTEDDGTVRQAGTGGSSNGWISKLLFGDNIDLIPIDTKGSESTGFCDYYWQSISNNIIVLRSDMFNKAEGGVGCVSADVSIVSSDTRYGSRLAFRGECVIE